MSVPDTHAEPPATASASYRVLVVDDEPFMRKAALAMLKALDCEADAVSSGEEAVERVKRDPRRFACALIDLSMTPMDGVECARALLSVTPSLRVLLMTGYNIENRARELHAHGIAAVIQKPLTLELLRQNIPASGGKRV